jgi:hypothetical protein
MERAFATWGFGAAFMLAACGGGVYPVVENGAPDGGSNTSVSDETSAADGGSGGNARDASTTRDAKTNGDSSSSCNYDAGGNSCFCGDLVCVNGVWGCGPCDTDAGPPTDCNPACAPGSICVRDQFMGGALFLPDDAGNCPSGRHLQGNACVDDPTYICAPYQCAAATPDCNDPCVADLCRTQNSCPYVCTSSQPGQVNCDCLAP